MTHEMDRPGGGAHPHPGLEMPSATSASSNTTTPSASPQSDRSRRARDRRRRGALVVPVELDGRMRLALVALNLVHRDERQDRGALAAAVTALVEDRLNVAAASPGASWLSNRFGLSPAVAAVTAELAGLKGGDR